MLSRHLLATLAYADVFDYPLTAMQIWRHLTPWEGQGSREVFPVSLGAVVTALDDLVAERRLEVENGFYVLPGRRSLVSLRLERMRTSLPRIRRARRLVRWLRGVPFVRMVALTGSLAMKHGDQESDWDLLIVLRRGHIWMGRFLLVLFLDLVGKRRHGVHVRDRACLNHWLTDGTLAIGLRDLFAAHEYTQAVPLYGETVYRRFLEANRWIAGFRPHFESEPLTPLWCLPESLLMTFIRDAGEVVFGDRLLERLVGRLQRAKIQRNPKSAWPGSYIVADDGALVFLPRPRGPSTFERYKSRLQTLLPAPAE